MAGRAAGQIGMPRSNRYARCLSCESSGARDGRGGFAKREEDRRCHAFCHICPVILSVRSFTLCTDFINLLISITALDATEPARRLRGGSEAIWDGIMSKLILIAD